MTGDRHNELWNEVERTYRREKGIESIGNGDFAGTRIMSFMRDCSTEAWLDFLELIAMAIKVMASDQYAYQRQTWQVTTYGQEAIDEINYRLRESGVGYQLESARLIRVDSQYVHTEIVKPALSLLSGLGFDGPRQEFMVAHQHYRSGEFRQSVTMAANALESTFKAIFDQKGWSYNQGARISDLIKVAKFNKLWPDYLDGSFDQLISTLQSGLPKIRDNDASHGQGAQLKNVPSYIAAYALHLSACKIVFITEAANS